VDDRETDRIIGSGRERGGMKKRKAKTKKSILDRMQELGQKYGVKVTDMSERGVRGIGFLGGVRRQNHRPHRKHSPTVRGGKRGSEVKSRGGAMV
jgi:hypothetical protein